MTVSERISAALLAKACGSIVAPAGYGKTETIADIVVASTGRCLLLTHTLAGVDALKKRLTAKNVKGDRYHLETIAAWSLRHASSYHIRPGGYLNAAWKRLAGDIHRCYQTPAVSYY
jgi:DNA helicase-2/ATP-dependent DNA helicase PcrA